MTNAVDANAAAMTPVELREHIQGFGLTQTELAQLLGANANATTHPPLPPT